MKKIFMIIGIFFVGSCIHEIIHLIQSGGHYFIVGIAILPDNWVFGGLAYTGIKVSEIPAYFIEYIFYFLCIWFFFIKKER